MPTTRKAAFAGSRRSATEAIEAQVQGGELYHVTLLIDGNELIPECTCPWFLDNDEECKHIWAVIRAASARRMLPERPLFLASDETLTAALRRRR